MESSVNLTNYSLHRTIQGKGRSLGEVSSSEAGKNVRCIKPITPELNRSKFPGQMIKIKVRGAVKWFLASG